MNNTLTLTLPPSLMATLQKIPAPHQFIVEAIEHYLNTHTVQATLERENETDHLSNEQKFVVMPMEEFKAWQETLYLLGNPANAAHLRQSIAEANRAMITIANDFDESLTDFTEYQTETPLRPLLGLWQGFTVTEDDIASARAEMWGDFGERGF